MSDTSGNYQFSAEKILGWLLFFTLAEVVWGYMGHAFGWGKLFWWGGLCVWALLKGFLIAAYFMHFKFEGWIVKGLIVPTPIFVLVILGVLSSDISRNEQLEHEIGAMRDKESGVVERYMEHTSARPGEGGH